MYPDTINAILGLYAMITLPIIIYWLSRVRVEVKEDHINICSVYVLLNLTGRHRDRRERRDLEAPAAVPLPGTGGESTIFSINYKHMYGLIDRQTHRRPSWRGLRELRRPSGSSSRSLPPLPHLSLP